MQTQMNNSLRGYLLSQIQNSSFLYTIKKDRIKRDSDALPEYEGVVTHKITSFFKELLGDLPLAEYILESDELACIVYDDTGLSLKQKDKPWPKQLYALLAVFVKDVMVSSVSRIRCNLTDSYPYRLAVFQEMCARINEVTELGFDCSVTSQQQHIVIVIQKK